MRLVRGSNNSSWSLRAWLALKHAELPFDEEVIQLGVDDTRARILRFSPTGQVPVLLDGSLLVWDSLAICEYAAELRPNAGLWPADRVLRATARSVSAEMHSGFLALRKTLPIQFALRFPVPARVGSFEPEVNADIERVIRIWEDCRSRFGQSGEFLFGSFTIADAMFAPVVSRFRTYNYPLEGVARAYADTIWALPAMQEWLAGAQREWA